MYTLSHGFQQGIVFQGNFNELQLQELKTIKNINFQVCHFDTTSFVYIYNSKKHQPLNVVSPSSIRKALGYETCKKCVNKLYHVDFYTVNKKTLTLIPISSFNIYQQELFDYHNHFIKLTKLLQKINYTAYFKISTK